MAQTVADFLLSRLGEWGVSRIYGYPGDGINGLLGALDRASDWMSFVQVRHEEMAAFVACGHAKCIGEVGVADAGGWIRGYGHQGNQLYVNRGLGFSLASIRINCPPELTVFTLRIGR